MKNNSPKRIALKTLIKNKHSLLNSYIDIKRIIESNQFTIIEYKKHTNSEPVSELIKRLGVQNEIEQNDSFLYIKNNLKFVFINADISDEDKCALLSHELGHICDPDLINNAVNCSKIKKEEFANEFSCYIKNPGNLFRIYVFILKKWKLLAGIIALIACILGFSFMINSLTAPPAKPVTGEASTFVPSNSTYYVTSSGKKYHQKHCIIVRYKNNLTQITLKDAINDGYKPCLICNIEKE